MSLRQAYPGGETETAGWWLHFDYDMELIEKLKAQVPASLRAWDETEWRWRIANAAEDIVRRLMPAAGAFFDQPRFLCRL